MRKLVPFLFLLLAIGCTNDKVVIKGVLSNAAEKTIYLSRLQVSGETQIDSLELKPNGKFKFKITCKNPEFLILRISDNDFITLQSSPEEKIEITGDAERFVKTYSVNGSEGSVKVKSLNDHLMRSKYQLDSVIDLYRSNMANPDSDAFLQRLNDSYDSLINVQRRFSIGFVLDNLTSFSSIAALYQKLDSSLLVFHKVLDLQYFKLVSDSLRNKYPRSPHVIALLENVKFFKKDLDRLKIENMVKDAKILESFEIALPDVKGDTVRLTSLRGKYVLLSFWASKNNASVQKNLKLKKIYDKYKTEKFEIYQVSLDNVKEDWEKEIKFSVLPWINVSDLEYPNSKVVKDYNVPEIPFNYLLNPKGEIIGRNLSITQLDEKLKKVIN